MADRILSRILRPLEKIYRFPGAQKGAPDTFELDLPIQPVHDVSQMAGFKSATWPINDGFFSFIERHTHAGAGTIASTPSPWTAAVGNGFPVNRGGVAPDICWWIINGWVTASNFQGSAFLIGVVHGSATVGVAVAGSSAKMEPVRYFHTDVLGGTGTDYFGVENASFLLPNSCPVRVMDNPSGLLQSYSWLQSTAAAAVNVDFQQKLWMGPSGILPPGC